jgi:small subunit ribosomal protein S1
MVTHLSTNKMSDDLKKDDLVEQTEDQVTTQEETTTEAVATEAPVAETPAEESSTESTEVTTEAPVEATETKPAPAKKAKSESPAYSMPSYDGSLSERVYTFEELNKSSEDYSEDEFEKLMNMYQGTLSSITEKEVVTGRIIGLDHKYVIVDIGFKSEGIVPLNEFRNASDVKIGDEIEVFLDRVEDREGQLVLSRRKADSLRAWQNIDEAHRNSKIIEGFIKRRIKGGMVVDVYGIDAFLPGSQIDVRPVRDFDAYVGKTMEFMVVKLNMSSENVVVSHRAIVEFDLEDQRKEILSTMEPGQILEGHVKNITDFGVFIDLGGVDGLLHITDLSWGRVEHPSEIVKLDQRLNVVVLEFDQGSKRISLGLKQLQPQPWDDIDNKYPEGMRVQGRVVSIADYGAFIELEKGVEGLVHISEMSWTQHIKHPSQLVEKNQVIECVILNINKDDRKISLGVKQLESDPWEKLLERYPANSQHTGIVRNLTNFGVFVELEPGIDGLVHISDLSWQEKINHPSEVVSKGDELKVVVLAIDFENRRITLGHKQIQENPWIKYAIEYGKGQLVEGEVKRYTDKGLFMTLPLGVDAFLPAREAEAGGDLSDTFKVGDKVKAVVIEFDEQNKNITVSQTQMNKAEALSESADAKKTRRKAVTEQAAPKALTLGEMSGLADLKEQLEGKDAEAEKAPKAKKAKAKTSDAAETEEKPKAKAKSKAKAKDERSESEQES